MHGCALLALDNTGSMADNGKSAAQKTATHNLLNQLQAAASNRDDVWDRARHRLNKVFRAYQRGLTRHRLQRYWRSARETPSGQVARTSPQQTAKQKTVLLAHEKQKARRIAPGLC